MALSRGTAANHLYHVGQPPPDEDHHAAEVAEPEFESLVAAAGRSPPQVMALDLLYLTQPRTIGTAQRPAAASTAAQGVPGNRRLAATAVRGRRAGPGFIDSAGRRVPHDAPSDMLEE